jgi:dipeptidyl aminopeptidase/acylaminoacyl peptidase
VEQTTIFAAAAALNGPANLFDQYLDLDPNERYISMSRNGMTLFDDKLWEWAELETEHGQMALGTQPWSAFDRYFENSPIRYIDRIRTPLLIMHSDTDGFDMHQADDLFAGMVRLGKEARYVRFWGEPHSLDAPANIRQFWAELVGWFNAHVRPDVSPAAPSPESR